MPSKLSWTFTLYDCFYITFNELFGVSLLLFFPNIMLMSVFLMQGNDTET